MGLANNAALRVACHLETLVQFHFNMIDHLSLFNLTLAPLRLTSLVSDLPSRLHATLTLVYRHLRYRKTPSFYFSPSQVHILQSFRYQRGFFGKCAGQGFYHSIFQIIIYIGKTGIEHTQLLGKRISLACHDMISPENDCSTKISRYTTTL